MTKVDENIHRIYGEKLRVRVCGICIQEDQILLVHHKSLGKTGSLWAPPGGGQEYGESAKESLKREFKEETGLDVSVGNFLFVHEYLHPPLHGIELFFEVTIIGGQIRLGTDPEMENDEQLLTNVGFFDLKALQSTEMESLHYVLQKTNELTDLINQSGYFKFH